MEAQPQMSQLNVSFCRSELHPAGRDESKAAQSRLFLVGFSSLNSLQLSINTFIPSAASCCFTQLNGTHGWTHLNLHGPREVADVDEEGDVRAVAEVKVLVGEAVFELLDVAPGDDGDLLPGLSAC